MADGWIDGSELIFILFDCESGKIWEAPKHKLIFILFLILDEGQVTQCRGICPFLCTVGFYASLLCGYP